MKFVRRTSVSKCERRRRRINATTTTTKNRILQLISVRGPTQQRIMTAEWDYFAVVGPAPCIQRDLAVVRNTHTDAEIRRKKQQEKDANNLANILRPSWLQISGITLLIAQNAAISALARLRNYYLKKLFLNTRKSGRPSIYFGRPRLFRMVFYASVF